MTIQEELKIKLDLLGTLGTITRDFLPASPDVIGVLYQYGGRMPERKFGQRGEGYATPSFQLVFRGVPHDHDGPMAKAHIAYYHLFEVLPGPLCVGVTTEYHTIDPLQLPFPIRAVDDNKRHHLGFNFHVTVER